MEGANNNVEESPAFEIWKDSKWIEFYQYDLYMALGLKNDARRIYEKWSNQTDDFPRPGTHWFRDFFYPLWRDHGHAQVMVNFFGLVAKHFPRGPYGKDKHPRYTRRMNWGEFIHFMSGAAHKDIRPLARRAFGWPRGVGRPLQEGARIFRRSNTKTIWPENESMPRSCRYLCLGLLLAVAWLGCECDLAVADPPGFTGSTTGAEREILCTTCTATFSNGAAIGITQSCLVALIRTCHRSREQRTQTQPIPECAGAEPGPTKADSAGRPCASVSSPIGARTTSAFGWLRSGLSRYRDVRIGCIQQVFLDGLIGPRRVADDDPRTATNNIVQPLFYFGGKTGDTPGTPDKHRAHDCSGPPSWEVNGASFIVAPLSCFFEVTLKSHRLTQRLCDTRPTGRDLATTLFISLSGFCETARSAAD